MIIRRSWLVYGTLAAIWLLLIGWQVAEHVHVRHTVHAGLRRHAEDISKTVAIIMRSQPRLFVSRERIETALNELIKQGEITSVELLNVAGEPVASAGDPIEVPKGELPAGGYWDENAGTVTLMNVVNLGTNIIFSASEFPTNRPPRREGEPPPGGDTNSPGGPPPDFRPPPPGPEFSPPPPPRPDNLPAGETNALSISNRPPGEDGRREPGRFRPRYSPDEIKLMVQNKGAHGFVMVMPSKLTDVIVGYDLWLRLFIGLLATVSVVVSGWAWRNLAKNSELQIRLVRASELNSHLKQMNVAAAGLAHETRNPLNIVRGLAQMIFKQEDASPEIRLKSREIIEETDRVAAQLNEFINYSRPREVRRAATRLNFVVAEVVRALNYDIEEKKVQLQNQVEELVIEADEQLLRQALFNLVLNAIQAVPMSSGQIIIRTGRENNSEVYLEIADNGHGVAPEHREEIFKPYFTTHEEGTGLGLAVVQQIVLAHGWEIECAPNPSGGAQFRLTHLKLTIKH